MKSKIYARYGCNIMVVLLASLLWSNSHAHEYSNLNEIMIDRSNDSISSSIIQVQSFLTTIFKQSYKTTSWPDIKLTVLRNDLMHQMEEASMSLDYFADAGVNIQSQEVLLDNPLAGRSVAASQGIETAYALLKHLNTLNGQDEFVKEIYTGGQSAHMYNLLTAYREKMDLYQYVFVTVPGPNQIQTEENTTVAPPQTSVMPYAIVFAVSAIVLVGLMLRKKS